MNEVVKPETYSEVFYGACPHDCPDTCSMLFEVKDGQLLSVRGNPDHPMTRGGLCVKLKDYEKRHYHPEDRKSTRLNSSHSGESRMPSSA